MPNRTDTSFTQPLPQELGLPFSFIPNQPLCRQEKSLDLCSPFSTPSNKITNHNRITIHCGVVFFFNRKSTIVNSQLSASRHSSAFSGLL